MFKDKRKRRILFIIDDDDVKECNYYGINKYEKIIFPCGAG